MSTCVKNNFLLQANALQTILMILEVRLSCWLTRTVPCKGIHYQINFHGWLSELKAMPEMGQQERHLSGKFEMNNDFIDRRYTLKALRIFSPSLRLLVNTGCNTS
jgi:hypothetical protein